MNALDTISNSEDYIGSQWIRDRFDFLNEYAKTAAEKDERESLRKLVNELNRLDVDYETLVRDSYFTIYIRDFLNDIGDIPHNLPDYIEIDWNATARNLRVDYVDIDFDGVTYWVRA